jgi:hypothetical protein
MTFIAKQRAFNAIMLLGKIVLDAASVFNRSV